MAPPITISPAITSVTNASTGGAIGPSQPCSYRVAARNVFGASPLSASISLTLAAPVAPVTTTAATGGTVAAGTYQTVVTYVNPAGETVGSASGPITTSGATSTITIPSPAASGNATGWYAYVSQVGGATASATRQQAAGSPTAIGTALTLTAPPTSTGASLPASNTATAPTSSTSTNSNTIQWGAVQGATSYDVWGTRGGIGGEQFVANVPAPMTSYTDYGTAGPGL